MILLEDSKFVKGKHVLLFDPKQKSIREARKKVLFSFLVFLFVFKLSSLSINLKDGGIYIWLNRIRNAM